MTAIQQARKAARAAFDRYLEQHRSTAAAYVPQCVIDAVRAIVPDAVVFGEGNLTHPVCSVDVRTAAQQRRLDRQR